MDANDLANELRQRTNLINARVDEMDRRFAERFAALERSLHGSATIRGWDAAARVLDITSPTVKRLFKTDTRFPKPSKVVALGAGRIRPEWTLNALLDYKLGRKR